jgi:hypothetical protein
MAEKHVGFGKISTGMKIKITFEKNAINFLIKKLSIMEDKFNHKIEVTISSFDGIEKASPRPFFFTRLEARMQNQKNIWEKISSFVAKPMVAFACICLIIMINAAVIFSSTNSTNSAASQNNELATADEYNLVSSTFYEFVNTKP